MSPTYCLFTLLLSIALLSTSIVSASHFNWVPRLSVLPPGTIVTAESGTNESRTLYFDQTLDHFSFRPESYATFKQKYVINFKYWGSANTSAPIFVYLGAEEAITRDVPIIGFLTDNAPRFKALIVYIEHRFYGESIPYGLSMEEALKDPDTRGYFNTAQALADYAAVIVHVKKTLQAHKSPVIVFGGSYGGMLASWFRLKYPHIAIGALASSAPILLPVNFTPHYGYYHIVSKGFLKTSETCFETIKQSWSVIDLVASKSRGLPYLSKTFKTCKPLNSSSDLKDFLIAQYSIVAQYNDPLTNPLATLCAAIDSNRSSNILSRIFAGLEAGSLTKSSTCYNINPPLNASQTTLGWAWQTCSDIVYALAYGNNSMFPPDDSHVLRSYIDNCRSSYGVDPRPHWISTYYGGQDIKLILRKFGSNIIFSNGLKDPYSNGGVLEDISDTIRAVYTAKGSHCLDIVTAAANDPDWLVNQRRTEVEIIGKWIDSHYNDLKS